MECGDFVTAFTRYGATAPFALGGGFAAVKAVTAVTALQTVGGPQRPIHRHPEFTKDL